MICIDLEIDEPGMSIQIQCSGTPSLGATFNVEATITDLDGVAVTGGTNTVNLYAPDDTLYDTWATATHLGDGVWRVNFTTENTDTEGVWLVIWTNTVGVVVNVGKHAVWLNDPPI